MYEPHIYEVFGILVDSLNIVFVDYVFGSKDELLTHWLLEQVHVHIRRVPMSELPQEADEISKWCHDAFEIKVIIKTLGTHHVLIYVFVLIQAG